MLILFPNPTGLANAADRILYFHKMNDSCKVLVRVPKRTRSRGFRVFVGKRCFDVLCLLTKVIYYFAGETDFHSNSSCNHGIVQKTYGFQIPLIVRHPLYQSILTIVNSQLAKSIYKSSTAQDYWLIKCDMEFISFSIKLLIKWQIWLNRNLIYSI